MSENNRNSGDYRTSHHYREWEASVARKKESRKKALINRSVVTACLIPSVIAMAAFVMSLPRIVEVTIVPLAEIYGEFDPRKLTVEKAPVGTGVDHIVVSGPRAIGMTKECRMLQGAGYKVVRNFHAGVYYKVSGDKKYETDHFGKLIDYLNNLEK